MVAILDWLFGKLEGPRAATKRPVAVPAALRQRESLGVVTRFEPSAESGAAPGGMGLSYSYFRED